MPGSSLQLLFSLIWVFGIYNNIPPHTWAKFLHRLSPFIMSHAGLDGYFTCGMGGSWPSDVLLGARGAIFNMGYNLRNHRCSSTSTIKCCVIIIVYCGYYVDSYGCKLFCYLSFISSAGIVHTEYALLHTPLLSDSLAHFLDTY